jgi:hypothetical protein
MNIRLHGTHAECATALEQLRHTPGLRVLDSSRAYPDRAGELVRVYLTVTFDPPIVPGSPAAGDGGQVQGGGR